MNSNSAAVNGDNNSKTIILPMNKPYDERNSNDSCGDDEDNNKCEPKNWREYKQNILNKKKKSSHRWLCYRIQ